MQTPRIRDRAAPRAEQQDRTLASIVLGVFTMLLAAAILATPALSADRYELRGSHVAIYNLAGEVTLEPGSGSAVVVHVTRGGRDAGELDVQTGPVRDVQTLRVVYPSDRVKYSRNFGWGSSTTLYVGDDGRFSDRDGKENRRRVRISGSGLDAHANLRIEVPRGQKVDLYLAVGEASASHIEGDLTLDVSAASVTTARTKGDLVIDVGSGSVEVSGAEGNLSIDTGSGSVDVMKVRGERVLIDTGSGRVNAADIRADQVNVDTGSGGVSLGMVAARSVLVDTGSGGVDLDLTEESLESLAVDTGSGSVTVRMPGTVGAEISVETGSGGIRSDLPMEIVRKSRDTLRGRIGDGSGRIVIETGSGGVRLMQR